MSNSFPNNSAAPHTQSRPSAYSLINVEPVIQPTAPITLRNSSEPSPTLCPPSATNPSSGLDVSEITKVLTLGSSGEPDQRDSCASPASTSTAVPDKEGQAGQGWDAAEKPSCQCTDNGRNLVVCIDGTANQFSKKNTNVVELYSRLTKDDKQLTYYDSGIGTYAKEEWSYTYFKQRVNHKIDEAIAWNFKRIILSAYQWLSENYRDGDRIFLFGFSRGAYQVRVIAGMIDRVGLLHKGNNNQIPFAFELYNSITETAEHVDSSTGPEQGMRARLPRWRSGAYAKKIEYKSEIDQLCERFKKTLSRSDVKVHFVGAWDTVSSIGFLRGPTLPETTKGMTHVCVFRHALALDELRVKFLPEYANGGAGPPTDGLGNVKEVWFAGSHSDVGGGNFINQDLDIFGPSLRWMSYEALECGLNMVPYIPKWSSSIPTPSSSLSFGWRLMEYLPWPRLLYKGPRSDATTMRLHRGRGRRVLANQEIHVSVLNALDNEYHPLASSKTPWNSTAIKNANLVASDPYTSTLAFLSKLNRNANDAATPFDAEEAKIFIRLSSSEVGIRAITEVPNSLDFMCSALQAESISPRPDIGNALLKTLAAFPAQPMASRKLYTEVTSFISGVGAPDQATRDKIIKSIVKGPFEGHTANIVCTAISPRGDFIVTGSLDCTVRLWCAKTGKELVAPLEGHSDIVTCVAVSSDGLRIASGSFDTTVRVWEAKTGKLLFSPLKGHWVWTVAFSSDGLRCVSGGYLDSTIRVWDLTGTGEHIQIQTAHEDGVGQLLYSTRILSIESDKTVRCWEATGQLVGELVGHTNGILCAAISPDGSRYATGSRDRTVRVWSAETMKEMVVTPMTDEIISIIFSADGRHVISVSKDGHIARVNAHMYTGDIVPTIRLHKWEAAPGSVRLTESSVVAIGLRDTREGVITHVRVWDTDTGKQLLGPLDEQMELEKPKWCPCPVARIRSET
ncbi:hypothetical protein HGRIS_000467 [Hohenbuehelia grisea]|uniref:T6SS Phospholipase effector Tle1-like catalytic domain-containing protein n=1 Tax=Hohenbuehelia grisea TaxID=104357 RepID=A0ABR3JT65_9AGAR